MIAPSSASTSLGVTLLLGLAACASAPPAEEPTEITITAPTAVASAAPSASSTAAGASASARRPEDELVHLSEASALCEIDPQACRPLTRSSAEKCGCFAYEGRVQQHCFVLCIAWEDGRSDRPPSRDQLLRPD